LGAASAGRISQWGEGYQARRRDRAPELADGAERSHAGEQAVASILDTAGRTDHCKKHLTTKETAQGYFAARTHARIVTTSCRPRIDRRDFMNAS